MTSATAPTTKPASHRPDRCPSPTHHRTGCAASPARCSSSAPSPSPWRRPSCRPPSTGPTSCASPQAWCCPTYAAGGTSLIWTWFAVAWTYGILLVPVLLLPAVLGRRDDAVFRAATFAGAISVVLSMAGFLRWVFVVPPLAADYVAGDDDHQDRGRGGLVRAAPVRRRTAGRAPRRAACHRVVGHGVGGHHPHAGPPAMAGLGRPRDEHPLLPQPGRHHEHGHPGLPGLGPRRRPRQHRRGASGSRPWASCS